MTLSRGGYRVLRKTRYLVRVENRILVPHGTHRPNQLVDDVEWVSRTNVNWLLEPGNANNLNGSRYACSNLIELVYSVSRFARLRISKNLAVRPMEVPDQARDGPG